MLHKDGNEGISLLHRDPNTRETAPDVESMQHAITRETLAGYGIRGGYTVASVSDVTSRGSGLGASSAYTVGLLNAVLNSTDVPYIMTPSPRDLADLACEVEMIRCGFPIGKQDQYAAAYGGFRLYQFFAGGHVTEAKIRADHHTLINLNRNLLLLNTGISRSANHILEKQKTAMLDESKFALVRSARDRAFEAERLLTFGKIDDFGALLHEAWMEKRNIVSDISTTKIDDVYEAARNGGAIGGKVLGAGGGGFMIFYAPFSDHEKIKNQVLEVAGPEAKFVDFSFTQNGSRVGLS